MSPNKLNREFLSDVGALIREMDMRDRRCGSKREIEKACSCLAHTINWSCHLKVKTEESFPNDFQTVFIASVQFSVFYAFSYHFLRLAQIVCYRKIRAISTWKLYLCDKNWLLCLKIDWVYEVILWRLNAYSSDTFAVTACCVRLSHIYKTYRWRSMKLATATKLLFTFNQTSNICHYFVRPDVPANSPLYNLIIWHRCNSTFYNVNRLLARQIAHFVMRFSIDLWKFIEPSTLHSIWSS